VLFSTPRGPPAELPTGCLRWRPPPPVPRPGRTVPTGCVGNTLGAHRPLRPCGPPIRRRGSSS